MRRRLDFVIPDRATARKIEDELLLAKVEDHHMHFLAKDSKTLGDLPEADLRQKSDLVFGAEKGLITGVITGVVAGTGVYLFTDLGAMFGGGCVLVLGMMGAAIGMWISAVVGSSIMNPRLARFTRTLEEGHILLMVDVPAERVEEIEELISKHHPEVDDFGVEATVPPFP